MERRFPVPGVGGAAAVAGRRVLAAVVDHALAALLAGVVAAPLLLLAGADASLLSGVAAAVWFGYFAGFEAYAGRTPGKRLFGLAVVTADGGPPDAAAAALRTLLRAVDWLPAGYLLGASVAAAGGDGRRVGDHAAGTRVVRVGVDVPSPRGVAPPDDPVA